MDASETGTALRYESTRDLWKDRLESPENCQLVPLRHSSPCVLSTPVDLSNRSPTIYNPISIYYNIQLMLDI